MAHRHRASSGLARTLVFCLVITLASTAQSMSWRDAREIPELVRSLENWLDENTSLPRRQEMATIRSTSVGLIPVQAVADRMAHGSNPRGFYDADSRTIWLVHPWNPHNPRDVSVLLHELVHHRQAMAGHWYCLGAQELPAYRLQQTWLDQFGLQADVNWIEVVLESGCTPRDIHPE